MPNHPRTLKSAAALASVMIVVLGSSIAEAGKAPQQPDRKVAVIVDLGDTGGMGRYTARGAEAAKEYYRQQGYELVVLSANRPHGSTDLAADRFRLDQALSGLRNVGDLRVEFFGHGTRVDIDEIPKESKGRFQASLVPKAFQDACDGPDCAARGGATAFMAATTQGRTNHNYDPNAMPTAKQTAENINNSISSKDLRNSLLRFQANNPKGAATLSFLNCFSGAAAIDLADLPHTQVFASSDPTKTAPELPKDPNSPPKPGVDRATQSTNYAQLKIDIAREEAAKGRHLSQRELHMAAMERILDTLKADTSGSRPAFPLLPEESTAFRWCAEQESTGGGRTPAGLAPASCPQPVSVPGSFAVPTELRSMVMKEVMKTNQRKLDWIRERIRDSSCSNADLPAIRAAIAKHKVEIRDQQKRILETTTRKMIEVVQAWKAEDRARILDRIQKQLHSIYSTYDDPSKSGADDRALLIQGSRWLDALTQEPQKYDLEKLRTETLNKLQLVLSALAAGMDKVRMEPGAPEIPLPGIIMSLAAPVMGAQADAKTGMPVTSEGIQALKAACSLQLPIGGDSAGGPPPGMTPPPGAVPPQGPPPPPPRGTIEEDFAGHLKNAKCLADNAHLAPSDAFIASMMLEKPRWPQCVALDDELKSLEAQRKCMNDFKSGASNDWWSIFAEKSEMADKP